MLKSLQQMKRHKPPLFNLPLYTLLWCILKPSSHMLQILSGRTKINKNKNQQSYCISSICHKIRYSYINANKKSRTRTSEVIKELGVVTFCLDAIMKQKSQKARKKPTAFTQPQCHLQLCWSHTPAMWGCLR